MAERSRLEPATYSAAGNRFAVLDSLVRALPAPSELARLAVDWCGRLDLDGLLVAGPGHEAPVRMTVYNRDGSRAEACGNGLRCVARFVRERGAGPDAFTIETDAGPRRVVCRLQAGEVVAVRTELGVPTIVELRTTVETPGGPLDAGRIDMGNPHCVVWVPDVERAPLGAVGLALQRDRRFPRGVNVSIAEVREAGDAQGRARDATAPSAARQPPGGWGGAVGGSSGDEADLRVRTFERGVGETAACGTGVGAVAAAALRLGRVCSPVRIQTRGGRLRVDWDGEGVLFLEGPVEAVAGARVG